MFLFTWSEVQAAVRISEVMYDVSGTDTGREWVEIWNDGSDAVDVSGFKLFEANSNHGLVLVSGEEVLPAGGVAVIADNPTKFIADWPGFSGTLFDSAFSLNNTGETLVLRNNELVDVSTMTYSSDMGANGDGNTLTLVSGDFVPKPASPGTHGSTPQVQDTEEESAAPESSVQAPSAAPVVVEEKYISVRAGNDRVVVAGADALFEAKVYGTAGEPITNPRVVWNFGNGERKEGTSLFFTYEYPGKYVVSVSASSGVYSATARFVVTVEGAQVALVPETDGSLSVLQKGKRELDISRWQVVEGSQTFMIPEGTRVLPGEKVRLSKRVTGFVGAGPALLLYPNGMVAATTAEVPLVSEPVTPEPVVPVAKVPKVVAVESVSKPFAAASLPVTVAAPIAAETPKEGNLLLWFLGAFGIGVLGAASVLAARWSRLDGREENYG